MIDDDDELSCTIHSVQKAMRDSRMLKNAAILRNITDLKPVLPNETRWSGKFEMLKRFHRIRNDLLEASRHEDSSLIKDNSPRLASRVRRYRDMLGEINVVTKSLQTRGLKINECRDDIATLIQAVSSDKNNPGTALYNCNMYFNHVSEFSAFEAGVAKLQ